MSVDWKTAVPPVIVAIRHSYPQAVVPLLPQAKEVAEKAAIPFLPLGGKTLS